MADILGEITGEKKHPSDRRKNPEADRPKGRADRRFRKPGFFNVIRSVGQVTFSEIVRDKVLYNILLCTLLLLAAGYLASKLTFIRPDRVILDFGLSAVNLSCAALAILIGAPMLSREFERRTIFIVLSKPVSRFEFLIGKFWGLGAVVGLNWLLLSIAYLGILYATKGEASGTLAWALLLVFFQSLMLSAIVLFFSTFSTTSLSVIFTVGAYLVGTNISQIRYIAARTQFPPAKLLLDSMAAILPNLEYFNLGTKVTYALPVNWHFGLTSILYGLVMISVFLLLSGWFVRNKEF